MTIGRLIHKSLNKINNSHYFLFKRVVSQSIVVYISNKLFYQTS